MATFEEAAISLLTGAVLNVQPHQHISPDFPDIYECSTFSCPFCGSDKFTQKSGEKVTMDDIEHARNCAYPFAKLVASHYEDEE